MKRTKQGIPNLNLKEINGRKKLLIPADQYLDNSDVSQFDLPDYDDAPYACREQE